MKKTLQIVGICLLLSSCVYAADPQANSSSKSLLYAKVGMGAAATAALSYTLWKLYKEMTAPKRYAATPNYMKDNAGQIVTDAVTTIGLGYLTWQSGLYTLEAMKELIEEEDDDEEEQPA